MNCLRDFATFLRYHKRWWLLPLGLIFVPLGILIYLGITAPPEIWPDCR